MRIFETGGTWFQVKVWAATLITQSVARSLRVLSTGSLVRAELRAAGAVRAACVPIKRLSFQEIHAPPSGLGRRAVVLREVRAAEIDARKAQELDGSWGELVSDTKVLVASAEAPNWRTVFASGVPGTVLLHAFQWYCGGFTGSAPATGLIASSGTTR